MTEFENTFTVPSGYIRLVDHEYSDYEDMPVKVESNKICVNASSIKISYVEDVQDPNNWDPLFQAFFEARLAEKLAYAVLQNATKAKEMDELAEKKKRLATSANAKEGTADKVLANQWLEARI